MYSEMKPCCPTRTKTLINRLITSIIFGAEISNVTGQKDTRKTCKTHHTLAMPSQFTFTPVTLFYFYEQMHIQTFSLVIPPIGVVGRQYLVVFRKTLEI